MNLSNTNPLALQCYELLGAIEDCGASSKLTHAATIAGDLMNKLDSINPKNAKQKFLAALLKQGEEYAGIILGKNGDPDHHLILLPGEAESVNWQTAKEFAAKAGGELPTRREQALLYANLKEQFQERAYWSSEQHASYSDYAWCQLFGYGGQGYRGKSAELSARAVRRSLVI